MGTAKRWGPLWGARPADWALSERQQIPKYEEVLSRVGLGPGQAVLDIGCGVGEFLRLAADRGAAAFGIDAANALLELARARVPEAEVIVGDMESLPYADDSFDLVTGFTSFFFADDMVTALREAARVAKPGASVVVDVWGDPEHNDLEAMKVIMRSFMPAPPPDAPEPPKLWHPGVLEAIAVEAGLTPKEAFDCSFAYTFADEETLARAMVAPAGISKLAGPQREPEVRENIVAALAPYRTDEGGYLLANEFRLLIATA